MPSWLLRKAGSSVLALALAPLIACNESPTVSLTAEDFRFVPDLVRIHESSPLILFVYNAGREIHEFDSPILKYAVITPSTETPANETPAKSAGPGIILEPGKAVQRVMALPRGTYLYICRRKGHANMTGTLIVE